MYLVKIVLEALNTNQEYRSIIKFMKIFKQKKIEDFLQNQNRLMLNHDENVKVQKN